MIRGLTPPLAALVTGAGVTVLATAVLVPGGLLLAAALLLAGVAVAVAAQAAGHAPGRRRAAARGQLSTTLVDALPGAPDLHAYGAMDDAVRRVQAADDAITAVERRDAVLLGLGAGAATLVAGLTLWGTLLLGVAAVDAGALGSVGLAVLALTALGAFEIVAPLPAAAARLGGVRASATRLFDVLDTPRRRPGPPGPQHPPRLQESHVPATALPESGFPAIEGGGGRLQVRGLRVRYGGLDLPPGRRGAVLGPSGSGKSTLAEVLFRFRDPDAGTVTLDGADVTAFDPDATRAVLAGVPQHPRSFAGTIAANLRLARPAPRTPSCGTCCNGSASPPT